MTAWVDNRQTESLFLAAVTIAEISFGIACLPDGRRREDLRARFDRFIARGFALRVLPFDEAAAHQYGDLMAHRRRLGRPMSVLDGQIAAIARVRQLGVATRNVRDFDACGLEVVNPFDPDAS